LGAQTRSELLHENCAPITLIVSRLGRRATALTSPVVAALRALIASVPPIASIIATVAHAVTVSWAVVAVVVVIPAAAVTVSRTVVTAAVASVAAVPGRAAAPTPAPDTSISTASITLVAVFAKVLHGVVAPASAWCIPVSAALSVTLGIVFRMAEWNKVGIVVEFGIAALFGGCLLDLAFLLSLGGVEELFNTLEIGHCVGEIVLYSET
jgi:hypothetical protein